MNLLKQVLKGHQWPLLGVLLLSGLSAALSIGVIAFINEELINSSAQLATSLLQFAGILLLLLVLSSTAQIALTTIGHRFVYDLRRKLVKRLLDTTMAQLQQTGSAHLLASLSTDVRNITLAFVRLPELVYGGLLSLAAFTYLAYLSLPLFAMIGLWIAFTLAVGWLLLKRLNTHLAGLREAEDALYHDYQAAIHGHQELLLNRYRASRVFELFDHHARDYRDHIILADTYNGMAANWANVMVLGSIGVTFYLAVGLQWADSAVAATYALTVLFLRTPLIGAVAAIPSLAAGRVALNKVQQLQLAEYQANFPRPQQQANWQQLSLKQVCYQYQSDHGDAGFAVGPIDFSVNRGELIFIVGGNGSGKSTFSRLLTGLYQASSGELLLDGQSQSWQQIDNYRQLFASVFSDYHSFDQLLGARDNSASETDIQQLLQQLQMAAKVDYSPAAISGIAQVHSTQLSQGQKKRLALILALLEQRDILLLDEWAADQDPHFRQVFYRELLPQLKAQGKTVIAITHDDHYFDQADRLFKMDAGQLHEIPHGSGATASVTRQAKETDSLI